MVGPPHGGSLEQSAEMVSIHRVSRLWPVGDPHARLAPPQE